MLTREEQIKKNQMARMPKEKKAAAPIPKRSASMKEFMKEYKPKVKAFLAKEENQICGMKLDGCAVQAVCVHHAEGRIGSKLLDESTWIPSCAPCNLGVEINDKLAREKGFKRSRLGKVNKG